MMSHAIMLKKGKLTIEDVAPILFLVFSIVMACAQPSPKDPEILTGFSEKVTALVTTTVRGNLRNDIGRQKLLMERIPFLEKNRTMNQLFNELKEIEKFKDLAYLVESDIWFELQKPEHQRERMSFHSPEIQREIISAIIAGMKKALSQLKGGKDGT